MQVRLLLHKAFLAINMIIQGQEMSIIYISTLITKKSIKGFIVIIQESSKCSLNLSNSNFFITSC